jgi:prophage maintenance system killer protein
METLLVLNGHELSCSVDEQEKVIGDLAAGQLSREDFSVWVESKTQKLSK